MSIDKEYLSHKYFRDMKVKNLKEFKEETPQGNIISGVICKKANHFLGSMVITEITLKEKDVTFEVEQFVQAMPKIHYYDNNHNMNQEGHTVYPVYEKLDGSCLILYGLYYDDELVEVVPKTRGLPVADSHIIEMFNEIDHCNIVSFFENLKTTNPTLLFELYGAMNQHSIFYPTVRINIRLIGATFDGSFCSDYDLDWICKQYDFKRPFKIFRIVFYNRTWKIRYSPGIFYHYLGLSEEESEELLSAEYPTQYDVIIGLKDAITRINKNYYAKNNRLLLEGGVINATNLSGEYFMYLKVKSADIEERCRTENGVPRKFVLKEVHKYFDEYGSQAKEIYQSNPNHVIDYVSENLLEEFDSVAVEMKRTRSRIKNVFLDMLEAKEPPKGLQDICNDLVSEYPDTKVPDLMRIFAQQYPEKKRYASMAYDIFSRLV